MEVRIEDFGTLDLRAGEIIEAEEVAGGILIKVDIGTVRKAFLDSNAYSPKELLGRKVVILANASAKLIHGIETNALMLTVKDGKKVSLLTVEKDVKNGAKIK